MNSKLLATALAICLDLNRERPADYMTPIATKPVRGPGGYLEAVSQLSSRKATETYPTPRRVGAFPAEYP